MNTRIYFIIVILFTAASAFGWQKTEHYGYHSTVPGSAASSSPATVIVANTTINQGSIQKTDETASTEEIDIINHTNEKKSDHSLFDQMLQTAVSDKGVVKYKYFRSQSDQLKKYINHLGENVPDRSTSRNEALAYWINLYNASTIKLIVDHYPVNSIMDIAGGKAFDKKWIMVGGEELSLNDIENDKIRAKYNEPRIHFAVNCAAQSCPPLWNRAWTASNLDTQLELRTRAFINNPKYNQISKDKIAISKIFEWYANDFPENITTYINGYSRVDLTQDAKVSYLEYDWSLNSQ